MTNVAHNELQPGGSVNAKLCNKTGVRSGPCSIQTQAARHSSERPLAAAKSRAAALF